MNQGRKSLIHGAQRGRVPRCSELKNSMEGIFQHFLNSAAYRYTPWVLLPSTVMTLPQM